MKRILRVLTAGAVGLTVVAAVGTAAWFIGGPVLYGIAMLALSLWFLGDIVLAERG